MISHVMVALIGAVECALGDGGAKDGGWGRGGGLGDGLIRSWITYTKYTCIHHRASSSVGQSHVMT